MLFFTLFSSYIAPFFRLAFFAPFLIIAYYQKSYLGALKSSFLCGIILDLLSSPLRFGIWTLNYLTTTALVYPQKRNFFSDSLITMPILVFLFSFISTVLQAVLLFIFSKPLKLSFAWIFTDLLFMPFLDSLFAFCWFVIPSFFFKLSAKRAAK